MAATSVNELRAQARVSKRTLYEQFGSKDELLVAYLSERGLSAAEAVLDREQLTPRARLLELFTALGCAQPAGPDPVLAATVEFPDRAHPVHQAAAEQAARLVERLRVLAGAAGAADPDRAARLLALIYAGAAARLLADDTETVLGDAHRLAASILREAIDLPGTERST
jgi:AcrR family transcriptional regulator